MSWPTLITAIAAFTVIAVNFVWFGKELSNKASHDEIVDLQVRIAQLEAHAANGLRWQDRIDLKLDGIDLKLDLLADKASQREGQ